MAWKALHLTLLEGFSMLPDLCDKLTKRLLSNWPKYKIGTFQKIYWLPLSCLPERFF